MSCCKISYRSCGESSKFPTDPHILELPVCVGLGFFLLPRTRWFHGKTHLRTTARLILQNAQLALDIQGSYILSPLLAVIIDFFKKIPVFESRGMKLVLFTQSQGASGIFYLLSNLGISQPR